MINLKKDIKKVKISSDPLSYSTLIYGVPKVGKSTFVHDLLGDKALFLSTENRERSLVGADVVKIRNWSDYSSAMSQLKRDRDLQAKYSVIVIDTVDNLWRFAEDYTMAHYDEEELGEASFGKDYSYLKRIWQDGLEKVAKAGFTPYFIGHSKLATVTVPADKQAVQELGSLAEKKTENGADYLEFQQYQNDLPERAFSPINKMVDSILFMNHKITKDGENQRVIYLRESVQHLAGSTFANIESVIPLDAKAYYKALENAVNHYDKSDQTDEDYNKPVADVDFDSILKEAKELGVQLVKAGRKEELTDLIAKRLGADTKLNEAKPNQYQQVEQIIEDLKELGG